MGITVGAAPITAVSWTVATVPTFTTAGTVRAWPTRGAGVVLVGRGRSAGSLPTIKRERGIRTQAILKHHIQPVLSAI